MRCRLSPSVCRRLRAVAVRVRRNAFEVQQQGPIFLGAGEFENKHSVGVLLNTKWRKESGGLNTSTRAIVKSITVNKQGTMLMSVYFPHTVHADNHVERAYKTIEKLTNPE